VAVARFALQDRLPLLVINLHAINFTVGSDQYRRQLDALGSLLDVHRGPVLLAGDFNRWNGARVRVLRRFMARHHLSELPISPDWRSRHFGHSVDAILLRGLRGIASAALPTRSSDHNPLIATLLPAPAPAVDSDAAGSAPEPAH